MKAAFFALLVSLAGASAGELLKTTDFTRGKEAWQGPGEVIHLSPDGKEQPTAGKDTVAVLRINLSKNRWSVLEHRVRLDKKDASASLKLVLQTSADFAPLPSSKEYAPEDFREGGEYGWSARIFPKAGLLIQLSDNDGWQYRPKSLKGASAWDTVTAGFEGLKSKQGETLALCFPPGEGHVDLKAVSFQSP